MEERAGFEPAAPFSAVVFKTTALNRSATSPGAAFPNTTNRSAARGVALKPLTEG
jgi:hypothetical protein